MNGHRITVRERLGLAVPDPTVGHYGTEKRDRIDLGLALLHRVALPGVRYTYEEIAVWCGCTSANIRRIEQAALKKLRNRLHIVKEPVLRELVAQALTNGREAAQPSRPRGRQP